MPRGIIVFGLNGSGKSTLGPELARLLGYKHMDIEDYYFIESEIPYTNQRSREDVIKLMSDDIKNHNNFVLSALKGDFDEEIISFYEFGVFIDAPKEIRIERLKQRSINKFGDRVKKGGDMYHSELKFIEYAKTRTLDNIEEWSKSITCPIIRVNGMKAIRENANFIIEEYLKILK